MFRKASLFVVIFLVLFCTINVWFFMLPSKNGLKNYLSLVAFSDPNSKENQKEKIEKTKQVRQKVSKQFLYTKDGHRLESRVESEQSELLLDTSSQGSEMVEHFQGIICTMQEDFFYGKNDAQEKKAMQLIRHFQAKNAIYSYKTGQLNALDVELSRYLLPEHFWPSSFISDSPLLKGEAQSVQVSLFHRTTFKARGLQATFNDWSLE
ncbi:MAG: hypothetical protein Q8K60_01470 [Parachlamydiaceae bacterium]|nr:hypothetical protein [Parachlamydiaceae bacterium]